MVYGADGLTLWRPGARNINLAHHAPLSFSGVGANLYCDAVCLPWIDGQRFHQKDELLYDIGAVVSLDSPADAKGIESGIESLRIVEATVADGVRYLFAANLSDTVEAVGVALPLLAEGFESLCGSKPSKEGDGWNLKLAPMETALLRLSHMRDLLDGAKARWKASRDYAAYLSKAVESNGQGCFRSDRRRRHKTYPRGPMRLVRRVVLDTGTPVFSRSRAIDVENLPSRCRDPGDDIFPVLLKSRQASTSF